MQLGKLGAHIPSQHVSPVYTDISHSSYSKFTPTLNSRVLHLLAYLGLGFRLLIVTPGLRRVCTLSAVLLRDVGVFNVIQAGLATWFMNPRNTTHHHSVSQPSLFTHALESLPRADHLLIDNLPGLLDTAARVVSVSCDQIVQF